MPSRAFQWLIVACIIAIPWRVFALTGIQQSLVQSEENITIITADAQATLTSAAAILPESQATLTSISTITFDSTTMNATLTTLEAIKADTATILEQRYAILSDATTTLTETEAIYPDLFATMTTLNSALFDVRVTITTENQIYTSISSLSTNLNQIETEAHATLTTCNSIKVDTNATWTNNIAISALLTTIQNTENSIKADTSSSVATYVTVQADSSNTYNQTNLIYSRASTLAVPFSGGTISSPGAYRLTGPYNGQIVIASSDVCLMLNGFTVTNVGGDVITMNGVSDIYISGGTLVSGGPLTSFACIRAQSTTNLVVERVMMEEAGYGIEMSVDNYTPLFRDLNFVHCKQGLVASPVFSPRIRRCLLQLDDISAQPGSTGITLNGHLLALTGGPEIRDCTIKGFETGMAIALLPDTIIENCDIGDTQMLEDATSQISGILLDRCIGSKIANCTINHLGMLPSVSHPQNTVYGISIINGDVLIINCALSNLFTTTLNGLNEVHGLSIGPASITFYYSGIMQNMVDTVSSSRAYGIYVDSSLDSVSVTKNVVSNVTSSVIGAGFRLASGVRPCIFAQNVAINMLGTSTGFSSIGNVTSGFVGSNTVFNFSLPT